MSYETPEEMKARVKAVAQEILGDLGMRERESVADARLALRAVADLCLNGADEHEFRTLEDVAARDMSALLRVISRSLGEPA